MSTETGTSTHGLTHTPFKELLKDWEPPPPQEHEPEEDNSGNLGSEDV